MQMTVGFWGIFIVFLVGACAKQSDHNEDFRLVVAGKPSATIIVSANPTPAVHLAALELQHHVERISGARLPITSEVDQVKGFKIHIGKTEYSDQKGIHDGDFGEQEYLILFDEENLLLYGRDWLPTPENRAENGVDILAISLKDTRDLIDYHMAINAGSEGPLQIELPGFYDPQGSLYATYDFLETALGIRWYGPSDFNVVYDKSANLSVKPESMRREPQMKYRYSTEVDGPMILAQYGYPSKDALALFYRRMRRGGEKWGANHTLSSFQDRFLIPESELFEGLQEEIFAKNRSGGPHSRQLCYTNESLVDQLIEDARDYFDGDGSKGLQIAIGDYFAILPLDNNQWCLCDQCQAVLSRDFEKFTGNHFSSGKASNYIFGMINQVAKGLQETHPEKKIATLAYHDNSYYPDQVVLEPNISVSPCLHNRNFMSPELKRHEMEWYRDWVDNAKAPVYLWNYSTFPTERGALGIGSYDGGGPWNVFPGFSAQIQHELIDMYHKDGIRGIFLCGTGEQLDFYLAMKHYDDPDLDLDIALDEFFNRYFGAAGEPMRRFHDKVEQVYNDYSRYPDRVKGENHFHQDEELAWQYLGTEIVMQELEKCIQEAKNAALSPVEQVRLDTWVAGVWEYMKKGRADYLQKVAGS
ncbi:DUF4838 domain-containing protein [Lunatimonas salinarum]|uniref:DUF4838 domain-containing protein n=1 Tax=Lunatimonas salinarum TaxID=1774590 RepID=UPI001ADF3F2B|nr:DUF4838 domain-containing protein [Lunatimonas salinarum]